MTEIEMRLTEEAGKFNKLFEDMKRGKTNLVDIYDQMKFVEKMFDNFHMFIDVDTRNSITTKLMHCMGWLELHVSAIQPYVKLRLILDSTTNLMRLTSTESDIDTLQSVFFGYQIAIDELMIVVNEAKLDEPTMRDLQFRIDEFKGRFENVMDPKTVEMWKFFKCQNQYEDLTRTFGLERKTEVPAPVSKSITTFLNHFRKKKDPDPAPAEN